MAAFIPALISGVSALAGGLFGGSQAKQSSTTNSNSTTNATATGSTQNTASSLPNYDPQQLQMRNYLMNQFYNQSNPSAIQGMVSNYIGSGTNDINTASNANQQALQASLAAQGLSYSPAASTALQNQGNQRIGQITALQNQAPLLASGLQNQYLTNFANFFSGLPVGQTSTGSSSSQGTQTSNTTGTSNTEGTATPAGGVLGGALGGLSSSLGLLYGLGAFKKN